MPISISSQVLGTLSVTVAETTGTLEVAVLATAPAVLSVELGTPGPAASVTVGSVTTLAPGSPATVNNSGTSLAAVLDFGIPAGPQGIQGIQGIQGPKGDTGATGVVAATSPLAYDSGTKTMSIDLSTYATQSWVTSQGYITSSALSPYLLSSTASSTYYPLSNPSGYITSSALSPYLLSATAATTYAVTARGLPTGGSAGESLLKVDGTNYNVTWGTPALASHSETTQATVRNNTGSTLTAGQIVYINGALGNRPTVALAKADAEATSAGTYAMVETAIPNNTDGTVITSGTVMTLDTSALSDGDKLYLSPTTAGAWTTTKPSAPNHLVYIGTVTRSHPNQGTIQLRIQNGYELEELHNVAISSVANGDLLAYESSTSLWKNKSVSTLGLLTSATAASTYYLQTNPAGYITSSALTGYATQSWVTSQGYLTSAPVTSVAGRTGAVTLAVADVSGAAPTASPTLTGTPLSTTAAADTNTTQIATTAFVVGQASSTTPAATGTAAVGTSLKYARADHVHANPLPTGGTAGQVLSKVDGTNYNVQWVAAGGGGGSGGCDVQTFGSSASSGSFTWTKPAGAKWVEILLFGAGGGGASGGRLATSVARYGGGGGGGGSMFYGRIGANYLGSTESVVVGAGGAGGASVTTNDTNGSNGSLGGNTTFSFLRAIGGTFGSSNIAGAARSSTVFFSNLNFGAGGNGSSTNGSSSSGTANYHIVPTGGGGAGGANAGSTSNGSGGSGGSFTVSTTTAGISTSVAGGTGGDPFGITPASAGTSSTTQYLQAGTGGGGGYYITGVAGNAGGNGGWPGGGGGGGGASDNGFASGKGGNGANGFAVIITYF